MISAIAAPSFMTVTLPDRAPVDPADFAQLEQDFRGR
jgi:hypothetical protein